MFPPAYDIIVDNPVETPDDTRATVDMLYEMPRPYTPNIFSLRIIPNTSMAKQFEDRGIDIPSITKFYHLGYDRTFANCLIFALSFWKMPKWLYKILRKKIYPIQIKQPRYPILFKLTHWGWMIKRIYDHLRFMDFSVLPGKVGYFLWKFGIIGFWQRFILKRYHLPKENTKVQS
jgi:hypothetical protein